ncbi:MAG: response regulator [Pusillimonas sp.]
MTPAVSPDSPKLLIVDDDRLVLAMLSKGLKNAGYTVAQASSGEQALTIRDSFQPDLAVLDISMPGMSGLTLATRLTETNPIPFIFLTAYADEETVREATRCGAIGYLVKPVDTAQLIPAIEAGLARATEIAQLQKSEENLTHALSTSREISVAIGIIMERAKLDQHSAFQALRAQARNSRQDMQSMAKAIIGALETLNQFKA